MKGQTNAWLKDIVSGEKISIILTTNQSSHADLMGAVITVSCAGNLTEYIWEGSAIQTVIPPMMDYTVSYSDINGYSTPKPFSGKAIDGRVSEVIGTYNTELVTVNVSADEGTVNGYEVTISKVNKYGSNNEYTELEYIESTGTQYIDTGFKPNQNTRLVMDFENIGDYSGMSTSLCPLFGARNASSSAVFALWIGSTSYPHYGNVAYNKNGSFSTNINSRLIYDFNKNIASIGSSSITCTTASFTTNYNLCILGANTGGTIDSRHPSGKLYSCQIYDNDVLVRDYVPVIDSNGVAGLWDKVNNIFYSSSSSTAFVAGDKVGEVIAMQTTPSASYKIPYGTLCTIKASDISGYTTPAIQSLTASQVTRNVDVIYSAVLKGVFIQDIHGRLYTEDEWDGTQTANGVAVLTDECEFVVAKEDKQTYMFEGAYGGFVLQKHITVESASTDYNGYGNTSLLIQEDDDFDSGLNYCNNYIFPNGQNGYLGAAGELLSLRNNSEQILQLLNLITGANKSLKKTYWTSTRGNNSDDFDEVMFWVSEQSSFREVPPASDIDEYWVYPFTKVVSPNDIVDFYINTTKHSCVKGMTWDSWSNSAFNKDGWYPDSDGNTIRRDEKMDLGVIEYIDEVHPMDIILPGGQYFISETVIQ